MANTMIALGLDPDGRPIPIRLTDAGALQVSGADGVDGGPGASKVGGFLLMGVNPSGRIRPLHVDEDGNIAVSGAGVSDHGALTGLADDDHSQYLLADGSRAATTLAVTNNGTIGGTLAVTGVTTLNAPTRFFAGTALLPGLTPIGDVDTGIYSAGADSIGIATGGVLRLTVATAAITATVPIIAPSGGAGAAAFAVGAVNTGLYVSGLLFVTVGGTVSAGFSSGGLDLGPRTLSWGSAHNSPDLILTRDAANTLAQRNGVNAQIFRIYNTYTDASNYERANIAWAANAFYVSTSRAGTGTARDIVFSPNVDAWRVKATTGHFVAETDNTHDIGASGATRPRALYLAGLARIGGDLDHDGTNVGFYGVAPVARQVVPTGSSTDTLITALQTLGLIAQS